MGQPTGVRPAILRFFATALLARTGSIENRKIAGLTPILKYSRATCECGEAAPAWVVSVLSPSPQRPERHKEKPGIEEQHNTLRLTRFTQNRGQRSDASRNRGLPDF